MPEKIERLGRGGDSANEEIPRDEASALQFVLNGRENLRGNVHLHGMEGEFGTHDASTYRQTTEGKASKAHLTAEKSSFVAKIPTFLTASPTGAHRMPTPLGYGCRPKRQPPSAHFLTFESDSARLV